jgi:hypothetical protein
VFTGTSTRLGRRPPAQKAPKARQAGGCRAYCVVNVPIFTALFPMGGVIHGALLIKV